MNIQKIGISTFTSFSTQKNQRRNNLVTYNYGLQHDTVSFGAKKGRKALQSAKDIARTAAEKARLAIENDGELPSKELEKNGRIWGITLDDARKIHNQILKPQKHIKEFMHNLFDDLVATESKQKNPILKIADREKKEVSIMEKSATNKWNSIQEVMDNMTDLNGAKIVMNKKTGQAETDYVLDRLIPMITSGQVELLEIEVKRPKAVKDLSQKKQEAYDYASMSMLKKLTEVQVNKWNSKNTAKENIRKVKFDPKKPQYTKGNYCAIHFLLKLPEKDARIFEVQLIGARMGEGKDLDDIIFKFFDGKQVDKKYNRIVKILETLNEEGNEAAKERFMQYRKDALLALREREISEAETKKVSKQNGNLFITNGRYALTPEYDLNYLFDLKNDCDKNAKIAAKNLEEARKVKKEKETAKKEELEAKNQPLFSQEMLNGLLEKFGSKKHKIIR